MSARDTKTTSAALSGAVWPLMASRRDLGDDVEEQSRAVTIIIISLRSVLTSRRSRGGGQVTASTLC